MKKIFHILPNAHLDPVWFWDQQEGLNEGIKTCSTIVKLMDRFPELTFNRGEASIYNHIQKTTPALFARIKELMAEGRWCAVGGSWIQPDQNMPSTIDFLRQFSVGRDYFKKELGISPLVAWAADPFGHSAGMPEIYAASGFKYFAFTRPNNHLFPLKDDVFRWIGQGGSSILGARFNSNWYGCERTAVIPELDGALERVKDRNRINIALGFGLGDHGGGPTARQIEDLMAWREQHPEVEVRFSTFDIFFAALEEELAAGLEIESFQGELNFCLRGCYASVPAFKHEFRKSSNLLRRAENSVRLINDYLKAPTPDFTETWRSMLFNCFHDIIPGSAIERALFEQRDELGCVAYTARCAEFEAVNRLCAQVAVKVPAVEGDMPEAVPYIVFNPSPRPYKGMVELEVSLDYRPLFGVKHEDKIVELRDADGKPVRYQELHTEHHSMPGCVWRKRLIFPASIPAFGWTVYTAGYVKEPQLAPTCDENPAVADGCSISNGLVSFTAIPGAYSMTVTMPDGKMLPISVARYEDKFGSWGGMAEEPDSFNLQNLLEMWPITRVKTVAAGPEKAILFVELKGARSRIELTVALRRGETNFTFDTRVIRDDRSSRLKLRFPQAESVIYDVTGGESKRLETGQVPGQRYVKVCNTTAGSFGFAADGGYSYDNQNGFFTYSLDKACRYSCDEYSTPETGIESPTERGELHINMILAANPDDIPALADGNAPKAYLTWTHDGPLPPSGSLLEIADSNVELVAVDTVNDKPVLTLQNRSDMPVLTTVKTPVVFRNVSLQPWKLTQVEL